MASVTPTQMTGPESRLHPLAFIFPSIAFQIFSTTSLSLHLLAGPACGAHLSTCEAKTPLPHPLTVSGRLSPLNPTNKPRVFLNKSVGCGHL